MKINNDEAYKTNALANIIKHFEAGDFDGAHVEWMRYSSVIPKEKYLLERLKYDDGTNQIEPSKTYSNVWSKIIAYLENYDFINADAEFKSQTHLIPEIDYLNTKLKYVQDPRTRAWMKIDFFFEKLDFEKADTIYRTYQDIISLESYENKKKSLRRRTDIWFKIQSYLDRYEFGEAEKLFNKNKEFKEFFNEQGYSVKKTDCVQNYFRECFNDGEMPFLLDKQQAEAVASFNENTLISARAGSGKTRVIVAKILYLLEQDKLKWDSIYVLAFNRNVPKEISERIQNKIRLTNNPSKYSKLDVALTFHKLSKSISENKQEILANNKKRFIKLILEHLKNTDPDFSRKVFSFFRDESLQIDRMRFKDPQDYYLHIRNSKYRTLKGETVKSLGEKWIADFLFEHGIEYQYEKSFYPRYIEVKNLPQNEEYQTRCEKFLKEGTDEIKPDFFLPNYKLVWEHWGIDVTEKDELKKEEFAATFGTSWQEYYDKMIWKQGFWRRKWRNDLLSSHWAIRDIYEVKKLIETSIQDIVLGREQFEARLINLLNAEGIGINKRNSEELVQEVWDNAIDRFTQMIESFINRYQQRFFDSKDTFIKNVETYKTKPRVYEFLKLGLQVLDLYEQQLPRPKKIGRLQQFNEKRLDFNQLVVEAIKKIEHGEADDVVKKMEWILIDEYQDFSQLFFKLIKAIRLRNPRVKFFCVGDNWQAINRFAGSDIIFFDHFEIFFENSEVRHVSKNYRSCRQIVETTNKFMKKSHFIGIPASAYREIYQPFSIVIEYIDQMFYNLDSDEDRVFINQFINKEGRRENDYRTKVRYLKKCFDIILNHPGKKVLILHRNNNFKFNIGLEEFLNKLCNVLIAKQILKTKAECRDMISIKTMHGSKGLESDVVILLEINKGILPVIHPDNELYEIFGEDINVNLEDQKRLFYVAMTRAKEYLYILCERDKKSDFLDLL